jgi:beta-galactosidase
LNHFGSGTLTYEGTALSDKLQQAVVLESLGDAGLTSSDQQLPPKVRVKHGISNEGRRLHYYLNYSSAPSHFTYRYPSGNDLLTDNAVNKDTEVTLKPWDLVIVEEAQAVN